MGSHVIVAGAGIVGLATAAELTRRGQSVTVLEKESGIAQHQTGNNSGVIHPGSTTSPAASRQRWARPERRRCGASPKSNGVSVEICGKLVVATDPSQVPALQELHRRGQAMASRVGMISAEKAKEYEPYISCVAAIRVESTGIVDFRGVCDALRRSRRAGGRRGPLGPRDRRDRVASRCA